MDRPIARLISLTLPLAFALAAPSVRGAATDPPSLLREGREAVLAGHAADALGPLIVAREGTDDPSLRRLSELWLDRARSAMPPQHEWAWAVVPSDDLGSLAGLDGLPCALAWFLTSKIEPSAPNVAPFDRVIAALDRIVNASPGLTEAARSPIQTQRGLKARLSLEPGPTGRPVFGGVIDESPDPSLMDAVKTFQTMRDLPPTGTVDAATFRALQESYERAVVAAPAGLEPARAGDLIAQVPCGMIVRSSYRVRDGFFSFDLVVVDARARTIHGPVDAGGPLESAPAVVVSALGRLLAEAGLPPVTVDAASDLPASLAELIEAGSAALAGARGDATLRREKLRRLADRNPGWVPIQTARDVADASPATTARWEAVLAQKLDLRKTLDEDGLLDGIDAAASRMPDAGARSLGRRGSTRLLGESGRLIIEGHFP